MKVEWFHGGNDMTWNHRIIRHPAPASYSAAGESFGIHEVYYDDDGVPIMCTADAVGVWSDTVLGLADVLDMMRRSLMEPVLDMLDFEEGGKYYNPGPFDFEEKPQ